MNEKNEQNEASKENGLFGENVIYSYTRAQAIADGVLVDVSETSREAGFKWPFAMTSEIWAMIEHIPAKHSHEDFQGRLWDILMVARYSISKAGKGDDIVFFDVILHHADGDKLKLKLHIGPGDDGSPVLTLMLPWQD